MNICIVTSHDGRHLQRLRQELEQLPFAQVNVVWRTYHFPEVMSSCPAPDFVIASGLCKRRYAAMPEYSMPCLFLRPFFSALAWRVPAAWIRQPPRRVVARIRKRQVRLEQLAAA